MNEKGKVDPTVQAMFSRSRLNHISVFIISQDYYKLSKITITDNGNIYDVFKKTTSEMFKISIKTKQVKI